MTARDDLTSEMARRPWSGCPTVWGIIKFCLYNLRRGCCKDGWEERGEGWEL